VQCTQEISQNGVVTRHLTAADIAAYVSDRLSRREAEQVETHVASCAQCRELMKDRDTALLRPAEPSSMPSSSDMQFASAQLVERTEVVRGATLQAGDQVDQFTVKQLVGRGAFGEVYLARDNKLGRKVALKIVRAAKLGSRDAVNRFIFEAKATAQFNHPNIVTIYDVGQHDGSPYFALEFLEGVPLQQICNKGALAERDAIDIAEQIASALQAAHTSGVVHRDLKPGNVFVPRDGPIRVLDFGMGVVFKDDPSNSVMRNLAERPERTTVGQVVGTPAYMAPEQWAGMSITPAVDVYSLGLIIFLMLAGERATGTPQSVEQLRDMALSPDALPNMHLLERQRESIRNLVTSCLMKRPEKRPSIMYVRTELRRILREELDFVVASDSNLQRPPMKHVEDTVPSQIAPSSEKTVMAPTVVVPEVKRTRSVPIAMAASIAMFGVLGGVVLSSTAEPTPERMPVARVEQVAPVAVAAEPTPATVQEEELVKIEPVQSEARSPAKPEVRSVELRGPEHIVWLLDGATIGKGSTRASIRADASSVLARDSTNGGVSRVRVVGNVADYAKLGKGKVWFQAKPYADVSLGKRALGSTPMEPLELTEGSYVATLKFEQKVRTEKFEVTPGATVHVRADMR
jgi:serine/threonine protein kinase